MAGQIHDNGLPVNRLIVDVTDSELAAILRSGWDRLTIIPEAPLMSVKHRLALAAQHWLANPIDLDPEDD